MSFFRYPALLVDIQTIDVSCVSGQAMVSQAVPVEQARHSSGFMGALATLVCTRCNCVVNVALTLCCWQGTLLGILITGVALDVKDAYPRKVFKLLVWNTDTNLPFFPVTL
jgi:hypothetical protein